MDTYNLTYNETQKKIVQVRKKYFSEDLTSLVFIRERVIVIYTMINPKAIVAAKLAFTSATKSNNRKMENNL